jgi:hypothetical protein
MLEATIELLEGTPLDTPALETTLERNWKLECFPSIHFIKWDGEKLAYWLNKRNGTIIFLLGLD